MQIRWDELIHLKYTQTPVTMGVRFYLSLHRFMLLTTISQLYVLTPLQTHRAFTVSWPPKWCKIMYQTTNVIKPLSCTKGKMPLMVYVEFLRLVRGHDISAFVKWASTLR